MKFLPVLLVSLLASFVSAQTDAPSKPKPKTSQAKKPAADKAKEESPSKKPAESKDKKEEEAPKKEMSNDKEKDKENDKEAEKDTSKPKDETHTDLPKQPEKIEIKAAKAPAATLKAEDIKDVSTAPENLKEPIQYALGLTERNLTYAYGSSNPSAGGMDCSGTIYHVLQKHGWNNIPRQSNEMYRWTWEAGTFKAFNGNSMNTFELKQIRPGDLMFWTNTVGKSDRDPPVTHVMMYLGKKSADGKPVMFGASDGRTYDGVQRWGVSVFDFVLPREGNTARFIGYAHLPEKEAKAPESEPEVAAEKKTPTKSKSKAKTSPASKKKVQKKE